MLVLTAGAGEVGQEMVVQGRRIPLGQAQSLVAQAARTGQGVTENDVRENPTFLPHPSLPDTRSEMAVPMIAGQQVIGVLDVQSDEAGRFTEEDVVIQTTLAAQVAVALENARSFEQAQDAIANLNNITRRLTREGWQDYVADLTTTDMGFVYDPSQLEPILPVSEDKESSSGKAISNGADPDVKKRFTQSLTIHGEQIGKLALLADEKAADIDVETAEIVAAIAEQLSARIENLRLTDQTQSALAETEMLYAASAALNAAQTYEDVFEVVQKHTKLGQKADFFNLGYFNRPWTEYEMPKWIDILAQSSGLIGAATTMLDLTALPDVQLLRRSELFIIEDVDNDPRLDERSRETIKGNQAINSAVYAPLVAGGLWIGYISLFFQNPPTILPEDGRRLMLLAGQAAVAVQSIRLLDNTRKRAQREQLLRQVTDRVRSSADVDTIMKTAVQEIGRVLGRRTYIYLDDQSLAAAEDAKE
jgi:GAF domain-containing protein